jgi:hypothetical protein
VLFRQACVLSQSARSGDILRRVHAGSVAGHRRIANTAALTPGPSPAAGRAGRVSTDWCFE